MRVYRIFFFPAFLFVISCVEKSKPLHITEIDELQSEKDVQVFIRKIDSAYKNYEVKKIADFTTKDIVFFENKKLATKLNVSESFYKTDFDNNGYTDLLILGDNHTCFESANQSCSYTPIALMNFGNNNYEIVGLTQGFNDIITPKIKKINSKNLLQIYKPVVKDWEQRIFEKEPSVQILEFKFDEFIEYNSNDKNYIPIKNIEFSTSGCFGTCPVFQMTIDQNRNATFIAEHFNFTDDMENWSENIEGKFHTVIDKKNYDKLISTLQYIDFPSLKDRYSVNWTDDQTVNLKITYSDNKVKTIDDYGAIGTYGLKSVYDQLYKLRKNQKWIKD
ncbi:hypothetical protein ASG31_04985 [Chryseobacterium sp. Leaf404]|nr:hypothetical protein ASG31_04985 [Chryseobacterium sp. Leaf404]